MLLETLDKRPVCDVIRQKFEMEKRKDRRASSEAANLNTVIEISFFLPGGKVVKMPCKGMRTIVYL